MPRQLHALVKHLGKDNKMIWRDPGEFEEVVVRWVSVFENVVVVWATAKKMTLGIMSKCLAKISYS